MSGTQQLLLTEGGGAAPNYIEDVFSTYLYEGNNSTQTITNQINLSGKGGMVWVKKRPSTAYEGNHKLYDTARGATKYVQSNDTAAQITDSTSLTSFNTNGFSLGSSNASNTSGSGYVSWSFRKQAKFFDVVTYTGNDASNRAIAHNLGSVPGCIMVKTVTGGTVGWHVYHRSLAAPTTSALQLETTDPVTAAAYFPTTPTSTDFYVAGSGYGVNNLGVTYVAYIFAHDAGGFGLTGTDNVISCGYGTAASSSSAINVTLGYEPQFILIKNATSASGGNWYLLDTMRGIGASGLANVLLADSATYETTVGTDAYPVSITSTGFSINLAYTSLGWGSSSDRFVYIAIRRGPMKVPTDATKVFAPIVSSATTGTAITTGFPIDLFIDRTDALSTTANIQAIDRLRGVSTTSTESGAFLRTNSTSAESTSTVTRNFNNTGFQITSGLSGINNIYWSFRRAPSFFDVVCYTGNDAYNRAIPHNLTVAPELVITKNRTYSPSNWAIYSAELGVGYQMALNTTAASGANPYVWGSSSPTSTNIYIGDDTRTNGTGYTYVAYLFATCAGVSKVGSYTGNGSTQTINCGFAGGARFVLIKRTDSTGDWYVYDTARGMTTLTDPYLLLNSTAAESATLGSVTTVTTGFAVNASILAAINTNAASYIFLAIA